jgi:hypothetical protein
LFFIRKPACVKITRYGQRLLVENKSGNLIQCSARRHIDLSVAGDQVIFQMVDKNTGVVTALLGFIHGKVFFDLFNVIRQFNFINENTNWQMAIFCNH